MDNTVEKKSYRSESRKDWCLSTSGNLSDERLKMGAIFRIADATEKIADGLGAVLHENEDLKKRLKYYQERTALLEDRVSSLHRTTSSLRGVITKLKKIAPAPAPEQHV